MATIDSELAAVRAEFVDEQRGYLREAEAVLEALSPGGDRSALMPLRMFFHRIAGVAANVGLRPLGAVADLAENVANFVAQGQLALTEDLKGVLLRALQEVKAQLDEATQPAEEPGLAPASGARLEPANPKILIIDDDPLSAMIVQRFLQNAGMQCRHCADPRRAVEELKVDPPHLVLLDLLMPTQDGYETCRQIRAHRAFERLPIIFITRASGVQESMLGIKQGADDVIIKPFEPADLVGRVRSHLQRQFLAGPGEHADAPPAAFQERVAQELQRLKAAHTPVCLGVVDLHPLQDVTQVFGPGGIALVAQRGLERALGALRRSDLVTRQGDRRLVMLFCETPWETAQSVMERIRSTVGGSPLALRPDRLLEVGVACGLAEANPEDDPASLLARAEAALELRPPASPRQAESA